ncbi:hypothetical protein UA08_04997 [Talaromyces atroroseus]|uniref:non-specific serine/threonine protein kinase n=1 Tax=Talaromyces atroroseus TaxID=1441469 RepID=A0A225AXY8_TALAT|nr:hypothetical protein UA08_04997 [Talaromyces atroroseus]OKL59325.1 hypothetical protein UA08_04997 [Talaromyces atroroseus]
MRTASFQYTLQTMSLEVIDQLRNEIRAVLKNGDIAEHDASLIKNYGSCKEILNCDVASTVRVAHKKIQNDDTRIEKLFAVKIFRRRHREPVKKYRDRVASEYCIARSLSHPHVVQTLDLLQDTRRNLCQVMEYCAGDLFALIRTVKRLEAVESDCYFKQLVLGIQYIHDMGVSHRNLKPENLLLTFQGALKIADFGCADCFRLPWERKSHNLYSLQGTVPYIAPEQFVLKMFDPRAIDIWPLGIIYVAMRTGRWLWRSATEDDEHYQEYLQYHKAEKYFQLERINGDYANFEYVKAYRRTVLYAILDPDPKTRVTISDILRSTWITGKDIKVCDAGKKGL